MLKGSCKICKGAALGITELQAADVNWLRGITSIYPAYESGPMSVLVLPKGEKSKKKIIEKKTNESFSRECLSSSIPAVSRGIHTLCWAVSCSSPPQSLPPPGMAPSEAWVPSCSCLAVPLSRQGKGRGTTEPPKCVFVIPLCCAPGTGLN